MKKRHRDIEPWYNSAAEEICPICERVIPEAQRDEHHLIPRLKGGKETRSLHRICHRQIHALFSESELARNYSTVEALCAHPEIQKFSQWVRSKPNDFMERTRKSRHRD